MPSQAPLLQASSQPTRFDPQIEAASAKHELDLKDVSITLAQKEILNNVHLKLKPGVRCVLHGKNGVGKSTVLRAIGERIITGIPRSLRILLLQQTESSDINFGDQTAVDFVVNSNVELLHLQRQQHCRYHIQLIQAVS
jgi:ATPase subunit of ABC transporter with duplicated ATPase domains